MAKRTGDSIEAIIEYKTKEIIRSCREAIIDGMRELYCMLLVAEKGEEARKSMSEDEYSLAIGALGEVKK
jgi:hypothetical protein